MSLPDRMAVDWIAVDWGTSRLRVWAMTGEGTVAAAAESDRGMGKLAPDEFEPALLALIADWLPAAATGAPVPVLACGMVGARQGWVEAAYRPVPCPPQGEGETTTAPCRDARIAVQLIPGLRQASPAPDVMRGEETQIAGFLHGRPDFDGVLCLPGTHTKWVRISAGEAVSFQTFMTGELFDLLARQSVLRHTVAADGWDDDAFAAALDDALSRPDRMAARLFTLRAAALLEGLAPATARARLSGALIGVELAAAKPYWLGQELALIGAPGLRAAYATALSSQGLRPREEDGDAMTLAGLVAARALMRPAP